MEKQVYEVGESPKITITTQGGLVLKGTGSPEVVVKADSRDDLDVAANEEEVSIQSRSNLVISAPRDSSIFLENVHSQAVIKGLEGPLKIGEIRGNCVLKDAGHVDADYIHGNLAAKRIEGTLSVRQVDGNVSVRRIEEGFHVGDVIRGNLVLDDVEGAVEAEIYGNANLRLDPVIGKNYSIKSRGNIVCRLPGDASVVVEIARGRNIQVNLMSLRVSETVQAPYTLTLGDGDASMNLEANGNILIVQRAPDLDMMDSFDFDFDVEKTAEEIGRHVTEQVEVQVEMIENQFEEQLEHLAATLGASGLSPEAAERISRKAREASAKATARTQEKMAKAQEKIQRKLEAAQRRIEQRTRAAEKRAQARESRGWGTSWTKSSPATPTSDPVTEEERLLILQMLSEKKISLEEAEKLLEALEGK
jgi:hypothetical protein